MLIMMEIVPENVFLLNQQGQQLVKIIFKFRHKLYLKKGRCISKGMLKFSHIYFFIMKTFRKSLAI